MCWPFVLAAVRQCFLKPLSVRTFATTQRGWQCLTEALEKAVINFIASAVHVEAIMAQICFDCMKPLIAPAKAHVFLGRLLREA